MYNDIVNFIHKLYRTEEFVPLHAPLFIGNEKKYLDECIDTTFVSSVGKFVDRFEEEIAAYTGAKKAVVSVVLMLFTWLCYLLILSVRMKS